MASDIDNASNALQLIGAKSINSFDDPGAGAAVMKAIYEPTVISLLTRANWGFALKKQSLNKLSQSPLDDFQNAFQIPTDSLKLLKVNPRIFYKVYQDKIFCDADSLNLDYIFRVETSLFPAYFNFALQYKLAADAALAVTDDRGKNELYETKFRAAIAEAYASDAQNNPQTPIVSQPFTDVRFQGGLNHGIF